MSPSSIPDIPDIQDTRPWRSSDATSEEPRVSGIERILVRVVIGVISSLPADGREDVRVLTPWHEAVPVPLSYVQDLSDVKECVRMLLRDTITHYGLGANQISHGAIFIPGKEQQFTSMNPLGGKHSKEIWHSYIQGIHDLWHEPCKDPAQCQLCSAPAFVAACFPESIWSAGPGANIHTRDVYCEAHGEVLRGLSVSEDNLYRQATQSKLTTSSSPLPTMQFPSLTSVPATTTMLERDARTPELVAPKPQSKRISGLLVSTQDSEALSIYLPDQECEKKDYFKGRDYSKATVRPTNVSDGFKSRADTCLTCIRYRRVCSGTTMHYRPINWTGLAGQWRCDMCNEYGRRCYWRESVVRVTTYDEAAAADHETKLYTN